MKKTILISGGAGFLGSNLCAKLLLNKNNFVICLDNLYTGSKDNIEKFKKNKNFKFINHDINNEIKIKVDEIYNFASPASPKSYQKDPIYTFKTNVFGTYNLLNVAKANNAKFLQASTSEIYGDPKVHPQVETYWGNVNPIGIRACYDEGKRAAETLCFDYIRTYKLNIKIVRIFNTYGPNLGIDDGRVISNFIMQALNNLDITIYGNGNQTRSFIYVDDIIDAFIKFMKINKNISGPLNLGNPKEYRIIDIAKKIISLTNSKSKLTFKTKPLDDPLMRKPNISLSKKILNWKPNYSLNEGLKVTIKYFKNK